MPVHDAPPGEQSLHEQVERKLVKIFGADRSAELLRLLLADLKLAAVVTTDDLIRVADLLQTRQGFEKTAGAMLSVMAAMRRSVGR